MNLCHNKSTVVWIQHWLAYGKHCTDLYCYHDKQALKTWTDFSVSNNYDMTWSFKMTMFIWKEQRISKIAAFNSSYLYAHYKIKFAFHQNEKIFIIRILIWKCLLRWSYFVAFNIMRNERYVVLIIACII